MKTRMKETCRIDTREQIELNRDGLPVYYTALFQCPRCKTIEPHKVGIFKKIKTPICDCTKVKLK